ncbi:SPX/EXS domain-containing protein [Nannizzia gypsea CBS 118893]|uniref:SPX/EXS domain-containing protein n=1 Tax=Arthroderma gypseum (strain ATCC MYA-4604 / CBS 118893) TaxID=535722 RepID=E4UUN1_ARTGP|nr:SPX/EXS domain-containing protein [Nannizzia gypsea CBS 118893]EFR00998.1 SPX/EXS domain-containing protein [Nannizzia gypsea CBS 118893]
MNLYTHTLENEVCKSGKKKVKAIARALRHVEQASWTPGRRRFSQISATRRDSVQFPLTPNDIPGFSSVTQRHAGNLANQTAPAPERPLLRTPASRFDQTEGYGSILPDPAIDPDDNYFTPRNESSTLYGDGHLTPYTKTQKKPRAGHNTQSGRGSLRKQISDRRPTVGTPSPRPSFIHRIFSSVPEYENSKAQAPAREQALAELKAKETEFFAFMDKELLKIETFYKLKEDESTKRLQLLRGQLHVMRDSRLEEIRIKRNKSKYEAEGDMSAIRGPAGQTATSWTRPLARGRGSHMGKTTRAMTQLATPSGPEPQAMPDEQRDYVTRKEYQSVPYSSAKRKLKLALLEFYRGLELLKSYADLNRKAFRKMNKKYDKVSYARPTGRYMTEKVNKAWFVQSDIVENHLVAVEDLYSRYFERGNRKAATHKLRGKSGVSTDFSPNSFRSGLLLAGGFVFAVQGLAYAIGHLFNDDIDVKTETSYLLQIYGGYFLILVHFFLFCLDCRVWTLSKINYIFVFEYDTRHVLDWRQLSELPSLFSLLLGLCMWLNFRWINSFYIYWPVVLIGLTVVTLFLPARILYYRSRLWWAYSHWRLLLAGLYPVEFRDFFLGDMYCSQTYAMGNIALFFCLYASRWDNPPMCNSSHSRALGFVTTVPSIWRGFQCLRRYYDTRNAFPHLVNFGKYSFSILYYLTLSLYRIDKSDTLRGIFITFACLNAIYASVWDLAMDWSLCNPYSKNPYLRDYLGFRRRWVYYIAMIIDPILRFNWILYAIFINDIQHSAVLSFAVALSEVCRRGMWTIFRVENEHCTNVGRFRASRDVPLPYDISMAVSDEEGASSIPPVPTSYTGRGSKSSPPHALGRMPTSGTAVSSGAAAHMPDLESGDGADASAGSLRRRHYSKREESTPPSGTLARVWAIENDPW